MMILHVKKTLVSKQYEYWFFTVLCLCYKQGLRISTTSCGLRKTDQDISKYSVLQSIALTCGCSSQVFIFDEFLCDVSTGSENIASGVRDLFHFALKKNIKNGGRIAL